MALAALTATAPRPGAPRPLARGSYYKEALVSARGPSLDRLRDRRAISGGAFSGSNELQRRGAERFQAPVGCSAGVQAGLDCSTGRRTGASAPQWPVFLARRTTPPPPSGGGWSTPTGSARPSFGSTTARMRLHWGPGLVSAASGYAYSDNAVRGRPRRRSDPPSCCTKRQRTAMSAGPPENGARRIHAGLRPGTGRSAGEWHVATTSAEQPRFGSHRPRWRRSATPPPKRPHR